ncbi:hypothetical protein RRG08_011569 [Elysia crispata]|uniref:Uncharacterized protein n=1 Tax=Elysia crispata TaxID=231223 RepID=A0AAE0XSV4_9GAST|nr:hypothetical protein RRG08_011569 [Elysia crispata]
MCLIITVCGYSGVRPVLGSANLVSSERSHSIISEPPNFLQLPGQISSMVFAELEVNSHLFLIQESYLKSLDPCSPRTLRWADCADILANFNYVFIP